MKKLDAFRIASVLAGLLLLAYVSVLLGRVAPSNDTTTSNFGEAGTSAFAELLARRGFIVRVEEAAFPRFQGDEVVILFVSDVSRKALDPFLEKRKFAGARFLICYLGESEGLETVTVESRLPRQTFPIFRDAGYKRAELPPSGGATILDTKSGVVALTLASAAQPLLLLNGEIAQNKYLDRERNADVMIGLVRAAAKGDPRAKVVFWDGHGTGRGLLDALGPWAHAGRNQALFAMFVLIVGLGVRFGRAPLLRERQTGDREATDALANLLLRWRGPVVGAEAAKESARWRLIRARKLPANAPREQWVKHLTPATIRAIERVEDLQAVPGKVAMSEVLKAARELGAAVDVEVAGVQQRA